MRIAQLVPECPWGEMTPDLLSKGVGGRETCALRLSQHWADMGHEVDNYVKVERTHVYEGRDGGRQLFAPFDLGLLNLQAFPYDAVVAVECPQVFTEDVVMERQAGAVRLTHMQVAHVDDRLDLSLIPDDATVWSCLSEWHWRFLREQGCTGEHVVHPNGVDMDLYRGATPGTLGPPQFFYSSSPDRGLEHMLDVWPRVRELLPDATLLVAYGVDHVVGMHRWSHNREGEMALNIRDVLALPGVEYAGKIGQAALAKIQIDAAGLLYPCDTASPTETGCITAIEAMAAFASVVTTDCDCLGEEFGHVSLMHPLPLDPQAFAESAARAAAPDEEVAQKLHEGRELAESRDWRRIAERWIAFIEGRRA